MALGVLQVKGSEGSLGVNVGYWELLLAAYLENMDKAFSAPQKRAFYLH